MLKFSLVVTEFDCSTVYRVVSCKAKELLGFSAYICHPLKYLEFVNNIGNELVGIFNNQHFAKAFGISANFFGMVI